LPRSICIYRKHRRNVRRDFPQIAIELHLHVPCFSNTRSIPGLEVCDFRENTRPLPCFANKSIEGGGIKKLLKDDFLSPHTGNWPSRRGESERIKNRIYSYQNFVILSSSHFFSLSLSRINIYLYRNTRCAWNLISTLLSVSVWGEKMIARGTRRPYWFFDFTLKYSR